MLRPFSAGGSLINPPASLGAGLCSACWLAYHEQHHPTALQPVRAAVQRLLGHCTAALLPPKRSTSKLFLEPERLGWRKETMSHKVDLFGNQGSHSQVCQWPGKTHLKHWELYFPFDLFCKILCPDELHPKLRKTAFKPRFRARSPAVCSVLRGACGTLPEGACQPRDPALALLIPSLWG